MTASLVNIANQKLRGADLKVEYSRGVGTAGRVDASVAVTRYSSYSYKSLPSVESVETVGYATFFNGTMPRWLSCATLAWSRGRWRANVAWQHIPGVTDPEGDGSERKPFEIRSYDSLDVSASCALDLRRKWINRFVVRTGMNNVFNRMPPFGGGTFVNANADTGTYNPIGRLVFVEGRFEY